MVNFPFSAVQGQSSFKLALILCAINPLIGGVLVSGPRGSAKSTLARGLADVMPGSGRHSFVTLPLGASEEMLVGSLDLEKVLSNKQVCFNPGLLAKAHGGVLYVDEVNLLPDTLVDLLLDVSASGVNCVERDGISHSHESRFILLGTMNPDEGELRLQLQDRFGLAVELSGQYAKQQRIDIVRLCEEFDRAPDAFVESWQSVQLGIASDIELARKCINRVNISDELRGEIAERCNAADVDGLRADIVWLRAAIAHAALEGRGDVDIEDLNAVEELVLSHRRKPGDSNKQQPMPPAQKKFSRPEQSSSPRENGDWGEMDPQSQKTAEIYVDQVNFSVRTAVASSSRRNISAFSRKKGAVNGGLRLSRSVKDEGSCLNWFQTLINNAGEWPFNRLCFKRKKQGKPVVHLVLLDTSASTLYGNGFAKAKTAVLSIAKQAYFEREQFTVMGFGNQQVDLLLSARRTPKMLKNWLDEVKAGGGTPVRECIEQARLYQQKLIRQTPGIQLKSYLITDGKSSHSLKNLALLGEVIVIDIEQSSVKHGKARQFAEQLGADYRLLSA